MINLVLLFLMSFSPAKEGPIELGDVNWIRSYDTAIQQAETKEKPIFILFQEVPGCATCRNYGQSVLSHPLIVEAIEDEFIPLAIFNNKRGEDAKVLARFNEPSWNNPVVRIIDEDEKQLTNRVSGNYSQLGVVDAMISSLVKSGREIPMYLRVLRDELQAEDSQSEIALSMYCFWSGEKELANMNGVIATEAGFMDGREVVKVRFAEDVTSVKDIYKQAKKVNCADGVYIPKTTKQDVFKDAKQYSSYRKDKESKYYLYKSSYRQVPMLALQELRVNRALATRQDPTEFLSPRQIALHKQLQSTNTSKQVNRIGTDFRQSWEEVSSQFKGS